MSDVNHFSMTGTVVSDFDLKVQRGGTRITCEFKISNTWFSGYTNETQYITCRLTGGAALHVSKYVAKGDCLFVSGFLRLYPPKATRPLAILRVTTYRYLNSPMYTKSGEDIYEAPLDAEGGMLDLATWRAEREVVMAGEDDYTALSAEEIDELLERDHERQQRGLETILKLRESKHDGDK